MTDKVVVVIPTYNREKTLREVLPSYASQHEVKAIIIIDDCSDKPFEEDGKWWKENFDVDFHIVRNKQRRGSPYSRNCGFELSNGYNWVLQSDDDVLLEENYVGKVLESIKRLKEVEPSVEFGAGLRVMAGQKPHGWQGKHTLDPHSFIMKTDQDFGTNTCEPFLNATMLFSRKFVDSGYHRGHSTPFLRYDEGLKGNAFREETDLQCQAWKHGFKSVLSSYAVCIHLEHKGGGQHQRSRWNYEYWSIRNHFRFLNRNYEFLNEYFGLNQSLLSWKLDFIKYFGERGLKLAKKKLGGFFI